MQLQRAAAPLPARRHDVPARQRQQAHRVAVDVGEEVPLHAAGQQGDASERAAARGQEFRQRGVGPRHVLQQRIHGGQTREATQQPGAPHERLDSPAPIAPEQAEDDGEPVGMREHAEQERLQQAPPQRPRPVPLDVGARGLEQRAERHAGRTRGLAGAAAEAEVEMVRVGLGDVETAFRHRAH